MESTTLTIRINAGVAILGSIVTVVLGSALAASAFVDAPVGRATEMIAGAILAAFLSAWGIVTGSCVFLRQRWARISMLVFSGMLVLLGIAAVVFAITVRAWTTGLLGVILAAVGVWWLMLFNRATVKDYFAASVRLKHVQ